MIDNKYILDRFGKELITECLDSVLDDIIPLINGELKWGILKKYEPLLDSLDSKNKSLFADFITIMSETMLFKVLQMLEDSKDLKLIFVSEKTEFNLVEISEMLKAELQNEDGWIERFSKVLPKYKEFIEKIQNESTGGSPDC
jgi:hypothetical protein